MSINLNGNQIRLVQESFLLVKPIQEKAADLFYSRLFELDPSVRPLFKGDMKEQGKKLMALLGTAVSSLNHLDKLIPAVQALGSRHRSYGVKDEHFEIVGSALIWTLSQGLGDRFTHETKTAWEITYSVLAGVMKNVQEVKTLPKSAQAISASPALPKKPAPEFTFWKRVGRWFYS